MSTEPCFSVRERILVGCSSTVQGTERPTRLLRGLPQKQRSNLVHMVLFEDSTALIGILIAALDTFASTKLDAPVFEGVASILIGLVLAGTASLLARESKSLLLGERADIKLSESILRIAEGGSLATRANGVLTVHLAPDQILVALSLEFADELRAPQIEDAVINIERKIRAAHPEVVTLFVKPQTAIAFKETIHLRFRDPPVGVVLR